MADEAPKKRTRRDKDKNACAQTVCPQDIVMAASALTLALTRGRTRCELESLIILLSLTTENLKSMLLQSQVNDKVPLQTDILI